MSLREEREIARLFEDARRADESSAPPFREVLARRRRRETPRGWLLGRPALVAAAVLLVAAALQLARGSRPRAPEPAPTGAAAAIASWKAPTDVFLRTPGSELLSQSPELTSSVRIEDIALSQTKGVRR